ncbi:hypothetical protein DB345_08950 [Spartobacteria bacterium LR76]|nr:hypothetical protein DB345_08950 [Spartobacteria bacterium LR76]
MRKWLTLILQTLVSVALLAWIFRDAATRREVVHFVREADLFWLVAGVASAGVGVILGVYRWEIFLRVMGIRLSAWELFRISMVGLFFNNFLVGAVGGDAVKVVWLGAKGHSKVSSLVSVLMDRMSGLGALVICSLVFIAGRLDWLSRSPVVAGVSQGVLVYLVAVLVFLAVTFVLAMRGVTDRLPARMPGRGHLVTFTSAYFKFVSHWRATLAASLLSCVILVSYIGTFYCAARAFGVHQPFVDFLAFMPAVDIIAALPVSLGGFGVRDQLFATLMGDLYGVPVAQAVSISLCGAFMSLAWGLVGLALLPSYRRVVRQEPETA